MVVRLLFICSLFPKLCCETYERWGNVGESFGLHLPIYPVFVRGAALLAKAMDCAAGCAAFGKCAVWVGLTFGLDMPKSAQIRRLVRRIEDAGARILNEEARILFADAPFLHAEARILLTGARTLVSEAPILKQVRKFLNLPAYFMNQVAYKSNL